MTDINKLLASRLCLKTSLEKSKSLATAIEKTGPRLQQITQNFPFIDILSVTKCTSVAVLEHIDRVINPAAAVLKIFYAVHDLENMLLSNPYDDLSHYLSVIKRLAEALKFLSSTCTLAIQWMNHTVEFLEENAVTNERYVSNLKKSLKILKGLKTKVESGVLLNAAFDRFQMEFRSILIETKKPLSKIADMQAIVEIFKANNRLDKCVSIFVDVRGSNIKASLEALGLGYLQVKITEVDSLMSIESHLEQWGKHLEFVIRVLFDLEFNLCNDVFKNVESDVKMGIFGAIVAESGFSDFLIFGLNVTKSKKDPLKLLKLLDIFSILNNLRENYNTLFGGKACVEIQTQTRNLIKMIVEVVSEIFWQLEFQVESQRFHTSPPIDGGVQRLVHFVIDYCEELLSENYKPVLTQVLIIQQTWKHEEYKEELLTNEISSILSAIEVNLDTWSKTYADKILSYVYRINNHCYICRKLYGTKLGELLGNLRLREHQQYVEYYASLYLRESWGRLRTVLIQEDTGIFYVGSANACLLVKKRLTKFNEIFEDTCSKHTNWVITDKGLREKICELILQTIVPAYKQYLMNYGALIEGDAKAGKLLKYSEESLEGMVGCLFKPKIGKYGSIKSSHFIAKIKNVVTNRFRELSVV